MRNIPGLEVFVCLWQKQTKAKKEFEDKASAYFLCFLLPSLAHFHSFSIFCSTFSLIHSANNFIRISNANIHQKMVRWFKLTENIYEALTHRVRALSLSPSHMHDGNVAEARGGVMIATAKNNKF